MTLADHAVAGLAVLGALLLIHRRFTAKPKPVVRVGRTLAAAMARNRRK